MNKTEIIFVLDSSGSMDLIKGDVEGSFATFIKDQKAIPGECAMSLYEFSNSLKVVFEAKPITQVQNLRLVPNGGTALIDSVVKVIDNTGKRLAAMNPSDRPSQILFVIATDGEENASEEYKLEDLKSRITHQTDVYNWNFLFLSANIDNFSAARDMGVCLDSSMSFTADSKGVASSFETMSKAATFYRSATNLAAKYVVTEEDRAKAEGK